MYDSVNHPNHYISKFGLESIDVIKAFTEGLEGYEAYATGNILKYVMRWKSKNGLEDLKKARWYLDSLIKKLELPELPKTNRTNNKGFNEEKEMEYKPEED